MHTRWPAASVGELTRRARESLEKSDLDSALAASDEALRSAPDDSDGYVFRGTVRQKKGDSSGALADFDQAIRLNPANARAHLERASFRLKVLDDADGALKDCDQAIRRAPGTTAISIRATGVMFLCAGCGRNAT